MELDVFIPELALGFEYNGEYHYMPIPMYQKTAVKYGRKKEEIQEGANILVFFFLLSSYQFRTNSQ